MSKTILYVGTDQDFLQQLKTAAGQLKQCQVFSAFPGVGILLCQAKAQNPHLILLDAHTTSVEEVRRLKSLPENKPLLIGVVCKDQEEVKQRSTLLLAGVMLFYVKGTEAEPFFNDCFYIAFGERKGFKVFARAKELDIKTQVSFVSGISSVSSGYFKLEADPIFSESLNLTLPFASEMGPLNFSIEQSYPLSHTGIFLNTYHLKFPYPGPWDEVTSQTLLPEQVEEWLSLQTAKQDSKLALISIISSNLALKTELLLDFQNQQLLDFPPPDPDQLKVCLQLRRPQLVLLEASESQTDRWEALVSACHGLDHSPVVVVFNSAASSEELRRRLGHPMVISVPGRLDLQTFCMLRERLSSARPDQSGEYVLPSNDPQRVVFIADDIWLDELTEHEVCFYSRRQIPYFSVLKFELPVPFLATVIPGSVKKTGRPEANHYQAIIHGISEENLTRLRKIVNQMIYNPVKILNTQVVEMMLKQEYLIPQGQAASAALPKELTTKPADSGEDYRPGPGERFILRRQLLGPSKL